VSGLFPVYNIVHILQLFVGLRPLVFMLFLDYAEVSLFHLVRLVRIKKHMETTLKIGKSAIYSSIIKYGISKFNSFAGDS
jgi:hypothetical protein